MSQSVRGWLTKERVCGRGHVVIAGETGRVNSKGLLICKECKRMNDTKRMAKRKMEARSD